MGKSSVAETKQAVDFEAFKSQVLEDFTLAAISREASLLGRREVLTGKAKFGISATGRNWHKLHWLNNSATAIFDRGITATKPS